MAEEDTGNCSHRRTAFQRPIAHPASSRERCWPRTLFSKGMAVSCVVATSAGMAVRPCDAFIATTTATTAPMPQPSPFTSTPFSSPLTQPSSSTQGPRRRRRIALHSSIIMDRRQMVTDSRIRYPNIFQRSPPSLSLPEDTEEWSLDEEGDDDSFLFDNQLASTAVLEPSTGSDTFQDSGTTAATTSINTTIARTLKLWKRRLVTREDWNHVHKITGTLFLLSSWGLTGYAMRDLLAHGWTQPVTSHGTPFLALLLVLLGTSVIQSFSSIRLACRHRRGQPAVRNTFLCNAAVAILGSVSALWSSAWYPACFNGGVSMAFYLIMDAIGLVGMADNLVRLKSLIASRQSMTMTAENLFVKGKNDNGADNNSNSNNNNIGIRMTRWHYWKEVFIYMMPILIGAPFFLAIGWQFGIQHDRSFYLNLLQRPGHPHLEAGAVYGMVMVAMGASYSSLIVTLRDKKLIRKRTEGLSLTVIMACLVGSLYQALRDPGTIAMIMGL